MSTSSKLRSHRQALRGGARPSRRSMKRNSGFEGDTSKDTWDFFVNVRPSFESYRDDRDRTVVYMGERLNERFDRDVLYPAILQMIPLYEERTGKREYAPSEGRYAREHALTLGRLFLDYAYFSRPDFPVEAGPQSTYR